MTKTKRPLVVHTSETPEYGSCMGTSTPIYSVLINWLLLRLWVRWINWWIQVGPDFPSRFSTKYQTTGISVEDQSSSVPGLLKEITEVLSHRVVCTGVYEGQGSFLGNHELDRTLTGKYIQIWCSVNCSPYHRVNDLIEMTNNAISFASPTRDTTYVYLHSFLTK